MICKKGMKKHYEQWFLGYIVKFKKQNAKQYIQYTTFWVRKGNEETYINLLIFATRNSERINQKTMKLVACKGC